MQLHERKTVQAFIWTNLLKAPFWAIFSILVFILTKDLNATPLQITLLIALKPVVSLFSPYWSALIHKRPDRLRSNLILATLIGHLPFFFFPFFSHPWFIVASGTLFLMMKRGIIPAWMELFKRNLPEKKRERTFSFGSIISYTTGAILPIFFARWLDITPGSWRFLFPIASFLSILTTFFLLRIPPIPSPSLKPPFDLKEILLRPWKNTWQLFKTRPDFNRYQIGFMLGGGGLMLMHPALPQFFLNDLRLSYTELAIAIATCKGVGFALTSPVWATIMNKLNIYRFSALVTLLAALFPCLLFVSKIQLIWVYIAYLIYGVMQAGSELSWHLSGPIFARSEDSSTYSSVNVVTVGLRGLFAPFCGTFLCVNFSPGTSLFAGGALCALACFQLLFSQRFSLPREEIEKNI